MTEYLPAGGEWRPRRATTIAAAAFSTVMPLFLFGAFASQIRGDIGLSDVEIGLVSGAFFGSSGVFGIPAGSIVTRIGPDRGMLLAIGASLTALIGFATLVSSPSHLVLLMLLAGGANALSQTSTSSAMLDAVPLRHYGVAFALKQTNGPVASIFSALVLGIVVTLSGGGWRMGFLIASGVVASLLLASLGLRTPAGAQRRDRGRTPAPLFQRPSASVLLLLVAATLAAAVAGVLAAFFVLFLLDSGITAVRAAGLLSTAGLAGIAGRLVWGLIADRTNVSLTRLLAVVFAIGASGLFLLPLSVVSDRITAVAILAFATAGSWQGMVLQRGATLARGSSAGTVGILMTGIGLGGSLGPPIFGAVVTSGSYRLAWSLAAALLLVSSLTMTALARSESEASDQPEDAAA